MTPDEYVAWIINKYAVGTQAETYYRMLDPSLRTWAGVHLAKTMIAGSYAKGTGVKGNTDVDIFISVRSTYPNLNGMYESLYQYALRMGWSPRKQNVSIGIQYNGAKIDLVPARIQEGYQIWHRLYRSKTGGWTQTNVDTQIRIVRDSGRTNEIRALKIWRNLRNLEFPSYYLELVTLEALKNRSTNDLANNFLKALEYLAGNITTARIVDPVNTANIISDDLTWNEKTAISTAAANSLRATDWNQVIWY